ncbi:hypothetical protein SKAU_G00148660 [Synaphobranchus kaupii]|uniref:Uncharacterized protein n=1 Tax=Synaphobranchus kaupii TaxID=118154 RepID=A0A9Q1J549_SYNKA|nr:hypothetical protein SKAU_G00148660 [Synaphobranchus kaupii]
MTCGRAGEDSIQSSGKCNCREAALLVLWNDSRPGSRLRFLRRPCSQPSSAQVDRPHVAAIREWKWGSKGERE